jgi:hypothetical protein
MSARNAPSDNGAGRKIRTARISSWKRQTIVMDRSPYRMSSLRCAVADAGPGGELLLLLHCNALVRARTQRTLSPSPGVYTTRALAQRSLFAKTGVRSGIFAPPMLIRGRRCRM